MIQPREKNEVEEVKATPDLSELIQFYALRQDPLEVTVESALFQRGWIAVADGQVVRAHTAGGKVGIEAFIEILSWDQPQAVELTTREINDRNIDRPITQLLLEAFWEALDHEPTDPTQDAIPMGLEEDTITEEITLGPPDGVSKDVLATARWLSELHGYVAVALLCSAYGSTIDIFGNRKQLAVIQWIGSLVPQVIPEENFEKAIFVYSDFIDILLPPIAGSPIAYLLRMDRHLTNRGLIEATLMKANFWKKST